MQRIILVIIFSTTVAACAGPKLIPVRMDGQRIAGSPVLAQAYEADHTICRGETQKANLSRTKHYYGGVAGIVESLDQVEAANDVYAGCMAQNGYAIVKEDEAEAKRAQYSAVANAATGSSPIATGSVAKQDAR